MSTKACSASDFAGLQGFELSASNSLDGLKLAEEKVPIFQLCGLSA